METNLVQQIKSYFTPEVISSLASHIGLDHRQTQSGVNVAIPSLLLGLKDNSHEGLSSVLTQAKHLFENFSIDHVFGNFFGSPTGNDNSQFESDNVLSSIYGGKLSGIISAISNALGIKGDAIMKIFGASLPAVISGITGKGSKWDVGSISSLLDSHKNEFAAALPPGLGLGAFGSSFAKAETPIELEPPPVIESSNAVVDPVTPILDEPPVVHTRETVEEQKKGAGIWWLLIPILLLLLWFFFGKGCGGDKTVLIGDTVVNEVDTAVNNVSVDTSAAVVRSFIDVKLPNGESVQAYSAGIEENLINFLQSDYKLLSDEQLKDKWFDFDNLNFETGTANVLPESQKQLENLAEILSIFPDAKIKIGGYTDKTGDEAINKKVSQARADAVKGFLESKGLAKQVVGAEGYGSEFATAAADAPESLRVKDRKVAVSVRK